MAPGPGPQSRSRAEGVGGVTRRYLESDDGEVEDEHLDSGTSSDHNESSNDSNDDASTDPDEIIDLPLPAEARIERKTSQMSLRRRGRMSMEMETGGGGESRDCSIDGVEAGGDDGGLEEGRRGKRVWESIRGLLGLGIRTSSRSEVRASRSMGGYGTI